MNILIDLENRVLQSTISYIARAMGYIVIKEWVHGAPDLHVPDLVVCGFDRVAQLLPKLDTQSKTHICVIGNPGQFKNELPHVQATTPICYFHFDLDTKSCIEDIAILLKKMQTRDFFGLDKYMGFAASISHKAVHNMQEKSDVLNHICGWVRSLAPEGLEAKFQDYAVEVTNCLDELLLNAIFHGNPRLRNSPIAQDYLLKEDEAVHVHWGCDGKYFGVSVIDPFGELSKDTVFTHLSRKSANKLGSRTGGRGLKSIFRLNHKLIVNVQPQIRSEVILLRELSVERRKRPQIETFHFFDAAHHAA